MSIDETYLQQVMRRFGHDVGAGIRAASGFSKLLRDGYSDVLDEKAINWLKLMENEAEINQKKLQAFSRYARFYGYELEKVKCNLEQLCQKVIGALPLEENYLQVKVGELPIINGYSSFWEIYFAELISNSLHHGGAVAGAPVKCHIYSENDSLVVSDNGAGLDKRVEGRALDPFFSTKSERHAGMGLPIVKRIVEIHEGQLRIESPIESPLNSNGGFRIYTQLSNI